MDLKALLQEALIEGNQEIREERISQFKTTVKNYIAEISKNNENIFSLQERNQAIKKAIAELDFKDFENITL